MSTEEPIATRLMEICRSDTCVAKLWMIPAVALSDRRSQPKLGGRPEAYVHCAYLFQEGGLYGLHLRQTGEEKVSKAADGKQLGERDPARSQQGNDITIRVSIGFPTAAALAPRM